MILKINVLAIDSSNVNSMKYTYASESGEISLNTKGNLDVLFYSGVMYRYLQVPLGVVLDVMFAESKGKAFNEKIKTSYTYEKLLT